MKDGANKHNQQSNTNHNEMNNFKGIYFDNNQEQKLFEGGAHFKYLDLYQRLEELDEHEKEYENVDQLYIHHQIEDSTIKLGENISGKFSENIPKKNLKINHNNLNKLSNFHFSNYNKKLQDFQKLKSSIRNKKNTNNYLITEIVANSKDNTVLKYENILKQNNSNIFQIENNKGNINTGILKNINSGNSRNLKNLKIKSFNNLTSVDISQNLINKNTNSSMNINNLSLTKINTQNPVTKTSDTSHISDNNYNRAVIEKKNALSDLTKGVFLKLINRKLIVIYKLTQAFFL